MIDPTHVLNRTFNQEQQCERCHMCTCHSMHKLIVECERIDGRVKV